MRLHSDTLTGADITRAAVHAGVYVIDCQTKGSRSRARAFDLGLSGSGAHRSQWGGDQRHAAATWDEWGIFLGVLFDRDPRMIAGGPNGYVGAVDYHWQTGSRFDRDPEGAARWPDSRVLSPAQQHRRHVWSVRDESCTGSYAVHRCECGAIRRRLSRGWTREALGLDVPTLAEAAEMAGAPIA